MSVGARAGMTELERGMILPFAKTYSPNVLELSIITFIKPRGANR